MGQVAAIVQAHAQDGVAILAEGLVDSVVCLCAGMGLYIGKAGAEELPGPLDGDVLHYIYALAAAVIPFSGVALRVFVGEHRTGSGQNGGADHVLRGDEFDVLLLAVIFRLNCLPTSGSAAVMKSMASWTNGNTPLSVDARRGGGRLPIIADGAEIQ